MGCPDFLHVDTVTRAAEYQAGFHRLRKPLGLPMVSTLGVNLGLDLPEQRSPLGPPEGS